MPPHPEGTRSKPPVSDFQRPPPSPEFSGRQRPADPLLLPSHTLRLSVLSRLWRTTGSCDPWSLPDPSRAPGASRSALHSPAPARAAGGSQQRRPRPAQTQATALPAPPPEHQRSAGVKTLHPLTAAGRPCSPSDERRLLQACPPLASTLALAAAFLRAVPSSWGALPAHTLPHASLTRLFSDPERPLLATLSR